MKELERDGQLPSTLPGVLEAIYQARVTGQILIVLHCQNGVPQAADVGRPTPIMANCKRIDFRASARKRLDNAAASPPT